MDIGKAFGYVFEDPKWVTKVLLGGLIALIPIIGAFAISGYAFKVAQNVARGVPQPLPEWSEFGDYLLRGFYGWVINIVYLAPVYVLYFIVVLSTGVGVALTSDSEGNGGAGGIIGLCLFPLVIVLALVCGLAALNAIARYLATDTFSEAFKFSEVINSLRSSVGPWLMLLLLAILASFAASLGLIACGIGVFFTAFYAQVVIGHGLGQTIARLFAGTTDTPIAYGPPSSTL